jgi:aspartate aminotransferase-like enzyme
MYQVRGYVFKQAETEDEFQQIHSLNYRTFVAEIGQHSDHGEPILVDKFHHKNTYYVALQGGRLVGMVGVHDQPPFSVGDRLSDPSILTRPGFKPLEVRLLAVEPQRRAGFVFGGVVYMIYLHALKRGCTHLIISALEDRRGLYDQMGFEPLGPAVPCGQARFIPMAVEIGKLAHTNRRFIELFGNRVGQDGDGTSQPESRTEENEEGEEEGDPSTFRVAGVFPGPHKPTLLDSRQGETPPVCLLPGPVTVAPVVHEAFRQSPIYHRGPEFIALFQKVRGILGDLVGGRDVALFNGSGTLGNEIVAATLAACPRRNRGLLLINGEFGERLTRQAARFGLQPRVLSWPWGQPWNLEEVEAALNEEPEGSWVWGVHQESSTGVLNDLPGLVRLAQARGVRVCMDCISSLGAVPLDLSKVYLATGATGKSLGSYAGIAIVFADRLSLTGLDWSRVPSYFDLPAALDSAGPRYTFPSPTLCALHAALAEYVPSARAVARYDRYARLGTFVRDHLRQVGLTPLADEACACPVVTTFAPPPGESAAEFVARCRTWGFAIGGQSGYLAERRLVQIATMGAITREDCLPLFERLRGYRGLGEARSRAAAALV